MIEMEKEIIRRGDLLWSLVRRSLKGRYIGSMMGLWWSVLNPLIMIAIYIVIFSHIVGGFKFKGVAVDYATFLCAGLLPWLCLSEALLSSCQVVVANGPLLKQVIFPRGILPFEAVVSSFIHFFIIMALFLLFTGAREFFPGTQGLISWPTLWLLPFIFVLQFFVLLGPSYLLATLNVFVRDTVQVLGALINVVFWATPIVYPAHYINSGIVQFWFRINPAYHLVQIYRDILMNQSYPALLSVIYLFILGAVFYIIGKLLFTRSQGHFVDEV